MTKAKVWQFELTEEDRALLNERGWSASPKIEAYADLSNAGLNDRFNIGEWFHAYKHVATVDSDDENEVFELMNRWHQPERVTSHAPHHSLSIGDVVEINGVCLLCVAFGWEPSPVSFTTCEGETIFGVSFSN